MPNGVGDLTDDYSDYNDASPEEIFSCDSPDYTIQIDEDYSEVRVKKLLRATNSGYKLNIFIDVTDDVDWWDYCYVTVYRRPKNGRGEEKKIWGSSDIQSYVDHSDGYWSKTDLSCGDCFPTKVLVETKFGTGGGWRDWEADVELKINGVNCGNTHIKAADWGIFHKWSYVNVAGCDYPCPAAFEAEKKREIDNDNANDGIIKLTAVDQYGVKWDNSGSDALKVVNLSFPENDRIEAMDSTGLNWKVSSDLGRNYQSTYAFYFKTGSNVYPLYTQKVTVRFVFPLKLNIFMDDRLITTYKGYQSDHVDIESLDVKPGYYLSKYKKSGSSGTIEFDEVTGKYQYYFGVENDTLTAVLKPITYTIEFDKNCDDATGTVTNRTVTYDKKFTFPSNHFKRKGYKFIGWNTEQSGMGTTYDSKDTVINLTDKRGGKVTFYAQWECEDGTLTGSMISHGVTALIAGTGALALTIIVCFAGWLLKKKGIILSKTDHV